MLDQPETNVLRTLFKSDSLLASQIAQNTGISRTAVYRPLKSLEEKGLVQRVKKESGDEYAAISYELFQKWKNAQMQKLKSELDDFDQFAKAQKGVLYKPQVQYFSGTKSVENLYHDSWRNNSEKIIYALTDYDAAYTTMGDFMEDDYFPERVARGVQVKSLLGPTRRGKADVVREKSLLREMRFLDGIQDIDLEINIYGDRVSLVQFKPKPIGVLLINEAMANSFKKIFKILWASAKQA